jgi:hypothetical protein
MPKSSLPNKKNIMEIISNTNSYTPRVAAEIISDRLGVKIGFKKYYKYLQSFGIIDEDHFINDSYDDGTLFMLEEQIILSPKTRKQVDVNLKVYATGRGIDLFIKLYLQHQLKP